MEGNLSILNRHPTRIDGPRLLHYLVRGKDGPESTAIHFLDADGAKHDISYRELHHRADKLARWLLHTSNSLTLSRSIVPVLVPQSPDLYIALLAILKAGGAFCPLSLNAPEDRLRFIVQDVSASLLITTAALRSRVPQDLPVTVVHADEDFNDLDWQASHEKASDGPHLAYVMYTSGSTGTPKGVCISHDAATQAMLAHERHIPKFSRFLQFASPTFDVSVFEIFFPLFRGATLVCCDRRRLLSDLPGVISAMDVDAAELTPSVTSSLLRGRTSVPSLKILLTIGEMLTLSLIGEFGSSSTDAAMLHGMYGPTEATIHCTLQANFAKDMPVGNIGVPLDTVSSFVIKDRSADDKLPSHVEVLPIGEIGELAIGGHQLADGYINRKAQTDAVFVDNPTYGRLYRTGDKVRLTHDGKLEFLGRIATGQVKLRGMRIELGEIEQAASRTTKCKATVAAVISGNLLVFCLIEPDALSEEQVLETCRKWLPAAMLPSSVILKESFPYLPSGKVDRRRLEEDFQSRIDAQDVERECSTDQLRLLCQVLSRALDVPILADSDLIAAGLDSLRSISLARKLREAGFPQLDASIIQRSQTTTDLDTAISQIGTGNAEGLPQEDGPNLFKDVFEATIKESCVRRNSSAVERVFGCTAVQASMLAETAQDPQAYWNWIELDIRDATAATVSDCFRELAHVHEMLRSGLVAIDSTDFSYAVVVWKTLCSEQIRTVDAFDYNSRTGDQQLAQPLTLQLRKSQRGVRLLIHVHHALYDQWSIDLLKKDLSVLLAGDDLPERRSFEIVARHHARYSNDAISKDISLSFWQGYLNGFTPSALPNFNSKIVEAGLQRTNWRMLILDMPALVRASKELKCSQPIFFQAAMALVQSSYVGTSDVVFGTVLSGRHIPIDGIEQVFGPCLNTVPTRVDISGSRYCKDLLHALRRSSRNVSNHSLTPLAEIKRVAGALPGSRLFDALFVWQETSHSEELRQDRVSVVDSADHLEFDLTLELEPTPAGIRARVTFQQSILPHAQASVFLDQLAYYVGYLIAHPTNSLQQVNAEMPDSAGSILNPDYHVYGSEPGLAGVIEGQAKRSPHAPAILFASELTQGKAVTQTVTYAELDEQANQLAHRLLSLGVLPNDLVCICMEKSPRLYVSILATAKAGAGYLPLTPDTPLARMRTILADAHVKLCLCDTESSSVLQSANSLALLAVDGANLSSEPVYNPSVSYNHRHLAYAVFTSGSTGKPKGVLVTNDNLFSNLQALAEIYPVREGDRLLQACPQAFDVSAFEIFFAFYQGMCLCAATKDTLFHDMEAAIRLLGVTHLSLTPTVASLIDPKNVPNVRFLVTAGEAVTTLVHRKWAGKGLYQGYGPSETTNICTVNDGVLSADRLSNVGQPLKNTSAFVHAIGQDFEVLPVGALGELAFGGQQVFQGYLNLETLNYSKIIRHSVYGRIYRSGDLGRILSDGTIQIAGRVDDQVKLRGNRIELDEINNIVLASPNVSDCTTLLIRDGDPRLVSFWVPNNEESTHGFYVCDTSEPVKAVNKELCRRLRETVPTYMIPSNLVPISRVPMTTQGKLDRIRMTVAFREVDQSMYDTEADERDVQEGNDMSDLERTLTETLCEVLKTPSAKVSKHASFASLGLDSIRATQYARALESKHLGRVKVSEILKNPNITRLGSALMKKPANHATVPMDPTTIFSNEFRDRVKREFLESNKGVLKILPCTPMQEIMLSAGAMEDSTAYSNIATFELTGDPSRLKLSWSVIVARHEILRTCFVTTDNPRYPYAQVVLDRADLIWHEVHTKSVHNFLAEQRKHPVIATSIHRPPFQMSLVFSKDRIHLVMQIHHVLYDAIAMSVLLAEVEANYCGNPLSCVANIEPFLQTVCNAQSEDSSAFWLENLRGFRPRPFQKRYQTPATGTHTLRQDITARVSGVEELCKRYSVSLLSVCQAAWAKVLAQCLDCTDVCFGNVVSGRTVSIPAIDRLVTPCFNTLPVRTNIDTCDSNMELVQKLDAHNVAALDYHLTPLRVIQSQLPERPGHLFDSLLLLQPKPVPLDSSIWTLVAEEGSMGVPLIIEVIPCDHTLLLSLHYDQSFINADTAKLLSAAFDSAIYSCTRYPLSDVSGFIEFDTKPLAGAITCTSDIMSNLSTRMIETTSLEPWSATETAIREVFAHLSGTTIQRVEKHTSMYRLGLDSLNSVKIAARLKKQDINVGAADVMENPTCASLAAVSQMQGEASSGVHQFDFDSFDAQHRRRFCDSVSVESTTVEGLRPCTPIQVGMLSQSIRSDGAQYVNQVTYEVPCHVSTTSLWEAWAAVQRRHQALRMGFAATDDPGHPFMMIIYEPSAMNMPRARVTASCNAQDIVRAIVNELHRPAWRISLIESDGIRCMALWLHHAIYDAESLQIMLTDLHATLNFIDLNSAPSIDASLAAILNSADDNKGNHRSFWSHYLQGARVTRFPNLSPVNVADGTFITVSHRCHASKSELESGCQQRGVTVQGLGQFVWAKLLSAYNGEPEVTFGVVLSDQNAHGNNRVAFPCISTVPVVCDTAEDSQSQLDSLMRFNASVQRHQNLPLIDIQRCAGSPDRALFDTLFVYQKRLNESVADFDWKLLQENSSADYPISLELESIKKYVNLRLTINTEIVPQAQAEIILRQYDALLLRELDREMSMPSFPDLGLNSVVPAKEPTISSTAALLHHFVELTALESPSAEALHFVHGLDHRHRSTTSWTYDELDRQGNRVAHLIRQRDVHEGDIVAVCMDKSPEASFAFVGILKAGCAFLAMDPALPKARKKFIMEDSDARLLLTTSHHLDVLHEEIIMPCIALDTVDFENLLSSAPAVSIEPLATSYVLYTSGTTGTPKGCEISHENAVQAMLAFQRLFAGHWTSDSKWLQFASYWFDVSILEQFWSWSVGICVVAAPRDLILDDLAFFIRTTKITHLDLTPSLARLLHPDDVPSLCEGLFITGGEALRQDILDVWGSKAVVCNGYGPTEATIGVTMFPFVGVNSKPSNIGWQFDNVGTYVLDPETDEPVLRGAIGELCVSGKLVGKGYLNRDELTRKQFPYIHRFEERVYRTGDLVRLLHDGSFIFIGRQDSQSKLRGQRLELAEIDAVIRASSQDVEDVVSMVIKSAQQQTELLVSYVVYKGGSRSSEPEVSNEYNHKLMIRKALDICRGQLPGYMVPTYVLPLTAMPLSVNNKVDTRQLQTLYEHLPAEKLQALSVIDDSRRPLHGLEHLVRDVLVSTLHNVSDGIGPETNLFTAGLDSVSAVAFARHLRGVGFKEATVHIVMTHSTVGALSSALSKHSTTQRGEIEGARMRIAACGQRYRQMASDRLGVSRFDIEAIAPCTPLQQGLIYESLKSDGRPYFNQFRFELGDTDLSRLKEAFNMLVDNLDILRTKFLETDEGYIQVTEWSPGLHWSEINVENSDIDNTLGLSKQHWCQASTDDLLRPFEVVIVHQASPPIMAVHLHHALYDGIAWDLLLDRLHDAYQSGRATSRGPSFHEALPCGPLRCVEEAKHFWTAELAGRVSNAFPCLITDPVELDSVVSRTVCADLEMARKSLGVSHQALIQACWITTLQELAPEVQILGLVTSGRCIDLYDVDGVVGPMFNTIPFAGQLGQNACWADVVRDCQQSNTRALPFQQTPLRDIKRWCGRNHSQTLFDTLFVFQTHDDSKDPTSRPPWEQVSISAQTDYPLSFEATFSLSGKLSVTLMAQRHIANSTILRQMLDRFELALIFAMTKPQKVVAEDFRVAAAGAKSASLNGTYETELSGIQDFPWTPIALKIREEIASLAKIDVLDVGEHISIFSLGLDSIDAVMLASRLKRSGIKISVSGIMHAQTIPRILSASQDLAQATSHNAEATRLQQLEQRLSRLQPSLSTRSDIERILPAAPNQEALIANMIKSDFSAYYNYDVLELSQDIELERFEDAWQSAVHASPILRTSFVALDDPEVDVAFAQIIHRPRPVHFKRVRRDRNIGLQHLFEQVRNEVKASLETEPPLRLTLLEHSKPCLLVLSLAHAQYDGYSLALLHEDVHRAYNGTAISRPIYDSVLGTALNGVDAQAKQYWQGALAGSTVRNFPRKAEASSTATLTTFRAERQCKIPAFRAQAFCRKQGVTMQALAQTCWALLLAHYARTLDVLFGIVLGCRDSEEAQQIMFPTMNTVVMRAIVHGTRAEMVQHMQAIIVQTMTFQQTPLRNIQAWCANVVRKDDHDAISDTRGSGLFDTLFIYQQRPVEEMASVNRLYRSVSSASGIDYSVAAEMEICDNRLVVRAACKSEVLDAKGAVTLLEVLDDVIQEVVNQPNKPSFAFVGMHTSICSLPCFPEREQNRPNAHGFISQGEPATDGSHEWSETERTLRYVLAKVSRTSEDAISKRTSIDAIGIDSISAIKFAKLLRKQSLHLKVSDILRARCIAKMAALLPESAHSVSPLKEEASTTLTYYVRKHGLDDRPAVYGLDLNNVESIMPATAGQIYMLCTWTSSGGQLFYPSFTYRLPASFSIAQIHNAWTAVVGRNRILRTVFFASGKAAVPLLQVVLKEIADSFHGAIDQRQPPRTAELKQPFVTMTAEQRREHWVLQLHIHHALYDAISLPIIMRDFVVQLHGSVSPLPPITYIDYLALGITDEAQNSRKAFWTQYLLESQPIRLKQPATTAQHRRIDMLRPGAFVYCDQLHQVAKLESVSLQAILFAAFAKVYAHGATISHRARSSQAAAEVSGDVILGIYMSNRSLLEGLETLAAPTLNLVPLLLRSASQRPLMELAKEVHVDLQQIRTAENSVVGLWEIQQWTGVKIDAFVNFLKLFDPEEDDTNALQQGGPLLHEVTVRRTTERALVTEPSGEVLHVPKELEIGLPMEAHPLSLDIEIAVREGALDVGLFCPEAMLSLDQAQRVVAELVSTLNELTGEKSADSSVAKITASRWANGVWEWVNSFHGLL